MTTKKYTGRQDCVLKSWGQNVEQYFYSEHSDPDRRVLKVCDENNVVVKQTAILWYIREHFSNGYEWYFFGDDDTFLNTRLLLTDLNSFARDKVNGNVCTGNSRLPYPQGGAGFLIHRELMPRFYDSIVYRGVPAGDIGFGCNMYRADVQMNHSYLFNQYRPGSYGRSFGDCYKYYTYHYVCDEMEQMEKICVEALRDKIIFV